MTAQLLAEATVQQIQLELIRRTNFNYFCGPRVADSLETHHDLWLAVCLDAPGVAQSTDSSGLLSGSLIKLRDLDRNKWNTDTLFVLTENPEQATVLGHIAEAENWNPDTITVHSNADTNAALGTGGAGYGLLSLWWD
ncbi:hypothetical protein [Nocardia blacklockiae]|uniref:hypothetical protein n=1 Tax=Nocardia blacklockiae TaxID=480036 RepID=UPI0018946735|nr:hypothetical protein [Nocardia blacklockiae]MBF6173600.1 hypothetical protein [Nocardia blacklockiae]